MHSVCFFGHRGVHAMCFRFGERAIFNCLTVNKISIVCPVCVNKNDTATLPKAPVEV